MDGFFYGVIEGFYGRQWSWQDRRAYANFLSDHGFGCYIYAPKGDPFFRSKWQQSFPAKLALELLQLGDVYHQAGLRWGVGLSPLNLYLDDSQEKRRDLKRKVAEINDLGVDTLCILFDDVRGDITDLAVRQLSIIDDILSVSKAAQHIICPTYYSFDPVLEQVFGRMPVNYWQDLAAGLPGSVDIFWTGNKVISRSFSEQDLSCISSLLGRRPILWDNYPVNDGRLTSSHLHLKAYAGRPSELSDWSRGHLVNPMNQPELSKLVLTTLAEVYRKKGDYNEELASQNSFLSALGENLTALLSRDAVLFQEQGLNAINEELRDQLIDQYRGFDHPITKELIEWLRGGYEFDPNCLTD